MDIFCTYVPNTYLKGFLLSFCICVCLLSQSQSLCAHLSAHMYVLMLYVVCCMCIIFTFSQLLIFVTFVSLFNRTSGHLLMM